MDCGCVHPTMETASAALLSVPIEVPAPPLHVSGRFGVHAESPAQLTTAVLLMGGVPKRQARLIARLQGAHLHHRHPVRAVHHRCLARQIDRHRAAGEHHGLRVRAGPGELCQSSGHPRRRRAAVRGPEMGRPSRRLSWVRRVCWGHSVCARATGRRTPIQGPGQAGLAGPQGDPLPAGGGLRASAGPRLDAVRCQRRAALHEGARWILPHHEGAGAPDVGPPSAVDAAEGEHSPHCHHQGTLLDGPEEHAKVPYISIHIIYYYKLYKMHKHT